MRETKNYIFFSRKCLFSQNRYFSTSFKKEMQMSSTCSPKCSGVLLQAPTIGVSFPVYMAQQKWQQHRLLRDFDIKSGRQKIKASFQRRTSGTSDHIMANVFIVKCFLSLGSLSVRLLVLLSRLSAQQLDISDIMLFFCMEKIKKEKRKERRILERVTDVSERFFVKLILQQRIDLYYNNCGSQKCYRHLVEYKDNTFASQRMCSLATDLAQEILQLINERVKARITVMRLCNSGMFHEYFV